MPEVRSRFDFSHCADLGQSHSNDSKGGGRVHLSRVLLGVTGVRSSITTDLAAIVRQIREVSDKPIAVGFGISTPEQAQAMAAISDGAIVGSALVKIIEESGEACAAAAYDYASLLAEAVKQEK